MFDPKKDEYAESWVEAVPPKGIIDAETKVVFKQLAEENGVNQRKLQIKMDFFILSPIILQIWFQNNLKLIMIQINKSKSRTSDQSELRVTTYIIRKIKIVM